MVRYILETQIKYIFNTNISYRHFDDDIIMLIYDNNQSLYDKYSKIIDDLLTKSKLIDLYTDAVDIIRIVINDHMKDPIDLNIFLLKILFHYNKTITQAYEFHDLDDFNHACIDLATIVKNILKNKYFDPFMYKIHIIDAFGFFIHNKYTEDSYNIYKIYAILIDIIKHKDFGLLINNNDLSRYIKYNFRPYINIKDLMKSIIIQKIE